MKFTKRNEYGLHCRFCKDRKGVGWKVVLYETSPITGIVCENCKRHLEVYLK